MNLAKMRIAWNVALVRLGVRHVLPREAVNRIPVAECGEPLVEWGGRKVRAGVAARLDEAAKRLPAGCALEVLEGWRSPGRQEELRRKAREAARARGLEGEELERAVARWAAGESGHGTGGAVDVRLLRGGKEAFCGSAWAEFGPGTDSHAAAGREAEANRAVLHAAMEAAGFANYPAEWWHFSYGDRLWAAYRGKRRAVYGAVEPSAAGGGREGGEGACANWGAVAVFLQSAARKCGILRDLAAKARDGEGTLPEEEFERRMRRIYADLNLAWHGRRGNPFPAEAAERTRRERFPAELAEGTVAGGRAGIPLAGKGVPERLQGKDSGRMPDMKACGGSSRDFIADAQGPPEARNRKGTDILKQRIEEETEK